MFARERHGEIRRIVREKRRVIFADLQKALKVSAATLRRDLTELEAAGDLIRVHGGVLDPAYARAEISFDERMRRSHAAKRSIAAAAAALIPLGATVIIDAGSTCLEAGKALLGRKDVRIITHSVALVAAGAHADAGIFCLGGELRRVSGALVGGNALGVLAEIRADFAFVGASGLSLEDGCSTTELTEAEIKKAILTRVKRTVLLADFSKWNAPSTVRFAKWDQIDDWITDQFPREEEMATLKAQKVAIHKA
ncbi:MAG TPA: DeoR/GlpR family DNA-binding transcription regulator [Chthoniobacterales bacterium]